MCLKAGVQLGILLKAKTEDVDVKDICKSTAFAIPVGISYEFSNVVLDFRYYCLKEKVEELKAALKNCKDDYMSIMQELARVDRIYKELAKKLGR